MAKGLTGLPNPIKLRIPHSVSQGSDGELERPSSKGKEPRPTAKVPNACQVVKEVSVLRQPGCWLRSSHHLKSA